MYHRVREKSKNISTNAFLLLLSGLFFSLVFLAVAIFGNRVERFGFVSQRKTQQTSFAAASNCVVSASESSLKSGSELQVMISQADLNHRYNLYVWDPRRQKYLYESSAKTAASPLIFFSIPQDSFNDPGDYGLFGWDSSSGVFCHPKEGVVVRKG